jgi:hypothetical protein
VYPTIVETYQSHIQPHFLPGWPSSFAIMLVVGIATLIGLAGLAALLRQWLRPVALRWLPAWLVVEGVWYWLWLNSLALWLILVVLWIVVPQEQLAQHFGQTPWFAGPVALSRKVLGNGGVMGAWLLLLAGSWWRWRVLRRRRVRAQSVTAATAAS